MSDTKSLRQRQVAADKIKQDFTTTTTSSTYAQPRILKTPSTSYASTSQSQSPFPSYTTAMEDLDLYDPCKPLLAMSDTVDPSSTSLSGRHVSSSSHEEPEPKAGAGEEDTENLSRKSQWVVLAIASGGCAAFNGVFAKLTTTELTTRFATGIANLIGLGSVEGRVEVVIRAIFFSLNLIFNGIMWALFTKALARGTSTTQVSILNTSSNFMVTAVLGFFIFSESLPPLWFLGAALLVAGNVIIGRREEGEKDGDEHVRAESGEGAYEGSREQEEGLLLAEEVELDEGLEGKVDEEDLPQLDLEGEERQGKSTTRSERSLI